MIKMKVSVIVTSEGGRGEGKGIELGRTTLNGFHSVMFDFFSWVALHGYSVFMFIYMSVYFIIKF